jgi:3-hydroxymyristoyl/3-hydroxydecanoyl-(acyl carrier protein) dehydratase
VNLSSLHISVLEKADQTIHAVWNVENDLPFLNGHFHDHPVVPAVIVLEAVLALARSTWGLGDARLRNVMNSKFLKVLVPGMRVRIEIQRLDETSFQAGLFLNSTAPRRETVARLRFSLTTGDVLNV